MDVRCERCKTEYELDDARVTEAGVPVKCATCGYVFRVKKKALVVTVPMRPGETAEGVAPLSPATQGVDKGEKGREWRIRQGNGSVALLRELTTLQRWIVERKVVRTDEISLTGDSWKRLGEIPELLPFFEIVEEAEKAHGMLQSQLEANARASLSAALAPPSVAPVAPAPLASAPAMTAAPAPVAPTPVVMAPPPAVAPQPQLTREPVTEIPLAPPPAPWSQLPESAAPEAPAPPPRTNSAEKWRAIGAPPETPRTPTPPPSRAVRTASRRTISEDDVPIASFRRKGGGVGAMVVVTVLFLGGAAAYYFWPRESAPDEPSTHPAAKPGSPPEAPTSESAEADAGPASASVPPDAGEPSAAAVAPPVPMDARQAPDTKSPASEEAPVPIDAGSALAVADAGAAAVVKREPVRDFDYYIAQGDRLRERDRPEAAMVAYGRAVDLSPDRAEAHAGRGLALLDLGKKVQAEASFQQALRLNPRYGVALMGLAETYRSIGKKEDAIRFYEKYLDVAPSGTEASAARTAIQKLQE